MHDFLVDPLRLDSAAEPVILASRRRQAEMRRTERHSHARGQLLGTMQGLVTIGTDHGRWLIPPINAVWLPPHIEHDFTSHGAFHGWSVYVAETACAALPKTPRVIRLSGLLDEAVARAASWREGPLSQAQERIAGVILDEIAAIPGEALDLPMPADPRLQRIARAIADDPAERQRMEDWAAWAGIAPRTLSRRFVLETGLTFSTWRQRALLLRSLEMLAAGNSVTTVAFDLGYETVSAFIELFRAHFGTTPARYFRQSA
ncbi:putative HTH-type transcriptional regulator, AraC family [Rhizobium freirei PRF 81]|uniref:Putative HTH-type transcriptional regulator, AraC family n=1 Tax=Rhizobium freirei PRF 81 TaxID=363754 RepID=N6UVV7_9HYPH|nr:helix-turn-helix transcriptional regulator [Rhizobium freirei]ENN84886.1 putative HTH-type transcriptional regulator, AraC family [Rhizobium freirei PRF 81]